MAKKKTIYICTNCGHNSVQWAGRCPTCNEWGTLQEEIVTNSKGSIPKKIEKHTPVILSQVRSENREERIRTGISEFDRVLGGGFVYGSVVLIGGDPGIGKSTLLLQAAAKLTTSSLYISGEESQYQIKSRAERLGIKSDKIKIFSGTDVDEVVSVAGIEKPGLIIVDSIQTIYSPELDNSPGTVTQIRECTMKLMQFAKTTNIPVVLIGHITKEGFLAGPKALEHIVDAVLHFEGEKNNFYRILRANKNRFGSTNEIGIFEMKSDGLIEVDNPSKIFLNQTEQHSSGSSVTAMIEGTRPILIEVQALVTPAHYSNPQRVTTGFDQKKLSILLAVLEKRADIMLSGHNVFINVAGGIKIDEPAADLAVCIAITSSFRDVVVSKDTLIIGEIGLGGELRAVSNIEKRVTEAVKLGFKNIVLPKNNIKALEKIKGCALHPVVNLEQAVNMLVRG